MAKKRLMLFLAGTLASIMRNLLVISCLCLLTGNVVSQNIFLSNGIGDVDDNYTYKKLIKTLGIPDSVYSFDPKNMNPTPKSPARTEVFYDDKLLKFSFFYFMLDTLTEKSSSPDIMIYKGSSITLNGDSISRLDSTFVVEKYGAPERFLRTGDDLTISYTFKKKKKFSLVTFYFGIGGYIDKIRIILGNF